MLALCCSTAAAQQRRTSPVKPQVVLYRHLFSYASFLESKAAEVEATGKNGAGIRNRLASEIGLNDQQRTFFAKIASEVDASLRAKEAEMRQVIATERAKYPGGRFTGSPPSVPVQLLKLGSERDAIVAAGIQRLQQQLGPEGFRLLDQYAQSRFSRSVKIPEKISSKPFTQNDFGTLP